MDVPNQTYIFEIWWTAFTALHMTKRKKNDRNVLYIVNWDWEPEGH